ncbi:MAG: type III pantothenate kinase [Bryobacteraceae bacterium]|nr:type III pantothenate kinase [Bryobacteraceae bacterium]MDW8379104.1 type III pantothenate kinase [Bryobacterales bacterium]
MLLALDVGNTNVTIGLFDGASLTHHWRLRTVHEQTADEWGILLLNLFRMSGLEPARIEGMIVSSVVPVLDSTLATTAQRYFRTQALFVSPDLDTGMRILYDNPREVGADRVVNAVAAFHKYGGPCVVVDLGTAITFDAVSASGDYMGGVICPGIGISISGLFAKTARLPMVDFREPEKLIGSNTVGSIQSGLYYGMIGMIDGVLERLIQEMGTHTKAVATGGQASLIVPASRYLRLLDEDLTLEGLRLIWERSRSWGKN